MADLFDYLDWRGDIPITSDGLNDVDRMILAQFSYLDIADLAPDFGRTVTIGELCRGICEDARDDRFHLPNDRKLAKRLCDAPRFSRLALTGFRERLDPEREEQFAALTVLLPDRTAVCVFRGTDWSLVGWKEDLNMALSDELPAQLDAVAYLDDLASRYNSLIRVLGHSKGGNLAIYSAAFAKPRVARRVIEAVSLDGPGFSHRVLSSEGYRALEPRIRVILPHSSLVGVIFAHTGRFTIVDSSAPRLMQHDLYSWKVMGASPIIMDSRDSSSIFIEGALNEWISGLTPAQREGFIDGVWSLFDSIGVTDLPEVLEGRNTIALIRALAHSDDETRAVISDVLSRLRVAIRSRK